MGDQLVTAIISFYSPTNEEEKMTDFYQCLSSLVTLVPNYNFLIINGYMNPQLGFSDVHKFAYKSSFNRNGVFLEYFYTGKKCLTNIYGWSIRTTVISKSSTPLLSGIRLKHYKQVPRNHLLIKRTIIVSLHMKRLQMSSS